MKTFRSVVQEAAKPKSRVILFGRMNPITKGHEENVTAAHAIAAKHGADLHVIASHSHDAKKNPLSAEQKVKHMKRAFGHLSNTTLETSSKEAPTILHHAAKAHAAGVKHLIIAGGGDRAAGYHKLLNDYNGVKGKPHGFYHFHKISVENTGERREGVSGTDMRKHAASGHFDKFKAGLPSKIAGNEKHAQEMYHDVRHGMGVHEESREDYVVGNRLRLGEDVLDSFTGLTGKIVYRGPTYVTVQVDEELSFKRWIDDVDSLAEEENNNPTMAGFKDYLKLPADIIKFHMDRLHYCPGAQDAFKQILGNGDYDQSLVLEAIDATAHYLSIEEMAHKDPDTLDDHSISEFNNHMREASQLLDKLGVLGLHRKYMEKHMHDMKDLINKKGMTEAKNIDFQGHMDLTDDDIRSIEKHIDMLEDEDIDHLYKQTQKAMGDKEMDPVDEELDLELDEALTAAQRMKKKIDFMKSKSRREISAQVARHRSSTPGKLKKHAVAAARTMIMQKILKGRKKAQLSNSEKERLESVLKKSKSAIIRISNRLLPKLRSAEAKRLSKLHHVKEARGPNQATDLDYDGEKHSVDTVAQNDTDVTDNPVLAHVKAHLSGIKPSTPSDPDPGNPGAGIKSQETIKRFKHFRKLEV
jgi:hypothetical protein